MDRPLPPKLTRLHPSAKSRLFVKDQTKAPCVVLKHELESRLLEAQVVKIL
jgi:hypothetical protein